VTRRLAWLAWATGCVALYAAVLVGFVVAIAVTGSGPVGLGVFTAWYAGGAAAATALVAWRMARSRP
jgi:hypothetical protein